jgi:superfamily II DNA/RNA helicase
MKQLEIKVPMYNNSRGPSRGFSSRGRSSFGGGRGPSRGGFAQRGGGRGGARGQKSFDPSHLVSKAPDQPIAEPVAYVAKNTFESLSLDPQLLKNLEHHGYTALTSIQDETIPILMTGKDVIGLANTGTGKTAAFLIPLINKIALDKNQKILIVAPTRELAVQIEQEFRQFSIGMRLFSALCIGGTSLYQQIQRLKQHPAVVIGTPGRLADLEQQRALNLNEFNNLVLDEVDQMVDMGFIRDVKHIVSQLPTPRQTLFFSATLPMELEQLTRQFLNDPVKISVKSRETSINIDQDIVKTNGRLKIDVLHEMLQQPDFTKVLVFLRTKRGTEKLTETLERRGLSVASIHGNKSQNQRQRAIDQFKHNRVRVLLATDVASRGLDIDNVTHVINFDLPESYEAYIHRIGRTGRADKKGIALTFVD